ncbi:unnamed protein product [Sympodiomycopsis kandeliae]
MHQGGGNNKLLDLDNLPRRYCSPSSVSSGKPVGMAHNLTSAVIGSSSIVATALTSIFGYPSDPLSTIDLSPSPTSAATWKPFYYHPHESVLPFINDKYLSLLLPIIIYWVISLWFTFLDAARIPFFEQYRLHEPEEITKRNKVSVSRVIGMVLIQQAIQTVLGAFVLEDEETMRKQVFQDHTGNMRNIGVWLARVVCGTVGHEQGLKVLNSHGTEAVQWLYWWVIPTFQFWFAFFILDAWQYTLHRACHESRFLYRHFHSHHHRLYVPYSFGALYNHPLEGLVFDSASGAIAHALSLMTVRQGILLFTFSTMKTVCDHGGYAFPWWLDPLHLLFPNCAEYHDVHHQMQGLRFNYSQPFFIHFDVVFGTRIGREKFEKMRDARLAQNKSYQDKKQEITAVDSASASKTTSVASPESTSIRKRNGVKSDVSPQAIAKEEKDPLVTTDLDSYKAKAGTATS